MKFSKILAVCLVALMTLAIFAACETGNEGEQSTEQTTQAPTENTTDSTVTTEPETTAPGEDTTEPGEDTTAPGEDTTEPGQDTTAPGEDSSEPGEDEIKTKFGALYTAFSYGAPPHAGMAPGVDRMIMLIAEEETIRDVIAFPLNGNAQDLMMGAPGEVTEQQLREVHIKVRD